MNDKGIDGYRDYLERRDGEADLLNRRLAGREEFFGGLEANPVRSAYPIDRGVFMRTCAAADPTRVWIARCSFSWPPPS